MKLHAVGTANRLNVEHRTFNFERPILMALRFFYFKAGEQLYAPRRTSAEGSTRFAWYFLN
jgi:hypothetical protein